MFEEQDYIGEDIAIPGLPTSVWLGTSKDYKYQSVDFLNTAYDLVIVGAGIAGLTTAYALSNSKKKILILDMGNVSRDVTGHTTAKVTSLHGLTYDFLIKKFGKETARLYGESQEEAIKLLSEIIKKENIECGFRKAKAIMYSMTPEGAREIKKEVEAAKKLGLPVCEKKDFSLPFEPLNTICFENQAQFHPTKYIFELAKRLNEKGVNIAEGVRVVSVNEKEELVEIQTTNGDIKTKQVVITTHFPIYDKGSFFAKLEARRAYAYAVKLKGDVPEGLYYCIDEPKYSFRPFDSVQDKLFIISGEGHKAGQANEEEKYLNLQDFANKYFDIESFDYHWSTQDNYPPDKIPFIGLSPNSKRVFMATGFRGWGMTNGTLSGFVLADLIRGRKNIYADIFNPSRKLSKVSSTKGLFAYNVNVAKELFVGKIKRPERFALPTELKVGGGSIVEYGGEKVAAFKDENSELHVLSPKCTHMGCNVKWNNAEKTWDCPCHGSRYSSEGKVIHSPAMRDLEQKNE